MNCFDRKTIENIVVDAVTYRDMEFVGCEFINCKFSDCTIIRCSFSECRFINCSVNSLQLDHSTMKHSDFIECNLIGIVWTQLLDGTVKEPIHKLEKCFLKYSSFEGMAFKRFDFRGTDIINSLFYKCNLSESNLRGCKLSETQFAESDVRKADFRDAIGYQIDILSTKMKNAKFSFPEVINLLGVLDIKID